MVAPVLVRTVVRAAQPSSDNEPYRPSVLPAGIRSRFVDNVNGLRVHRARSGLRRESPRGRPAPRIP
jgi:hypothetical protein